MHSSFGGPVPYEVSGLNRLQLFMAIFEIRRRLRYARDQKGDDRCWLDYIPIWKMLEDTKPFVWPTHAEALYRCALYYQNCRAETPEPEIFNELKVNPAEWNKDLVSLSTEDLAFLLNYLLVSIRLHRDLPWPKRTLDHDRHLLYSSLPEPAAPDFRLPPRAEFLGLTQTVSDSGCIPFWTSHTKCRTCAHRLDKWGPCAPTD